MTYLEIGQEPTTLGLGHKKKAFNCIGNEKCCDTSKHRLPTLDGLEPPRRLLPPCRLARTE